MTSLLVPFFKKYQFLNKNQFKLEYKRGVFRNIAVRRFKEVLKTEGEARGFQHFPADIKSVTSHSDTKPMASLCFESIPGYYRQEV